jgi:zinc transport system permease protein
MADFLLYALLAGLALALIAGPLGCFVVWQRLAYFGDTLAHSALLGVALSLWLSLNITATVIGCSLLLAILLLVLQRNPQLGTDSLLGLLSHASLALGLLAVSLMGSSGVDLNAYLFGDLLAVSRNDLTLILVVSAVLMALLLHHWRALLNLTLHEELAQVEGYPVLKLRLLLMVMLAVLVAVAIKAIGVLLITALLIIPASAARPFARSPAQMAGLAAALGCLSIIGGLQLSLSLDTPAGPSVVVAATALFLLGQLKPRRRSSAQQ